MDAPPIASPQTSSSDPIPQPSSPDPADETVRTPPSSPPCFSWEAQQSSSPGPADETVRTPPSSPPCFPWEARQSTSHAKDDNTIASKPTNNALSVLGKRRSILEPASHNARPHKRLHRGSACGTAKLKQMQLSLGQKVEKSCVECGMVFVASSMEDRRLHADYHDTMQRGPVVGDDFVQRSQSFSRRVFPITCKSAKTIAGDAICLVARDDAKWRQRHARRVLNVITSSLGACPISDEELWKRDVRHDGYKMYLYVRGGRCISAVLIESCPPNVRRVLPPASAVAEPTAKDALAQLKARRKVKKMSSLSALRLSDRSCQTQRGISRIWTAPACRGQSLASALLDCVYDDRPKYLATNTIVASPSKMTDLAFSQPTDAGVRLARKWFGQLYEWCVY